MAEPAIEADIIVAGAGATGLALGLALARDDWRVIVAGPDDMPAASRTVALLEGSIRLLDRLGVWGRLRGAAQPLALMRLIDDTGSLFAPPPVEFVASEIGLPAFGCNIRNADLTAGLAYAAGAEANFSRAPHKLKSLDFSGACVTAACDDGSILRAPLIVAADGRRSKVRPAAGIGAREWSYRQEALTALLRHRLPHRDASTEFHTREGPCTLVPLRDGPDGGHHSSLVWMVSPARAEILAALPDDDFAAAVARQTHSLLGPMSVTGGRSRVAMGGLRAERMIGPRTALVGEAGHAFPPIGAQGLNLGLRDVAQLAQCLAAARGRGDDIGAPASLARYERMRRFDVDARTAGVDLLNRALLAGAGPIDVPRGAGLALLGRIGPLRRMAMRIGLAPDARIA